MKAKDVPQDPSFYRGGVRACYAVGEDGRYVVATSRGFEAETVATALAMEELAERREAVRLRVVAGELSPLAWHLEARMMTVPLLASHVRMARWRVRRHLRPEIFRRLPDRILERYAAALGVTRGTLSRVPESADGGIPV